MSDDGEEKRERGRSISAALTDAIISVITAWAKYMLEEAFRKEINWVENRYRKATRRAKFIALLLTTSAILSIIFLFVWLIVGVVYITENTALSQDIIGLLVGFILGYLACLATGFIFMRE